MFGYSKCRQPVGPMSVSTTDDEQMLSFCPGRLAFKIEGAGKARRKMPFCFVVSFVACFL